MRFLCLSGMGTNSQIIESQLAQITSQLPGKNEFFYLNGDVESEPAPGIENFFSGPYYCFYSLPIPSEVQSAFELIDEIIEEEGPFDGVIGFSQGAALGSSYLLQDAKRAQPREPFKCAIFFCASMPFDLDSRAFTVDKVKGLCYWADNGEEIVGWNITDSIPEATSAGYSGKYDETTKFLRRYPSVGKPSIKIPTAHIVGLNDDYYSQSCALRDLCLPQHRQFYEHRSGHDIPKDRNNTVKIVQCLQNTIQAVLAG